MNRPASKPNLNLSSSVNAFTTFTQLYSQLNLEQKLAVDTIEGPVMVVAGPGTGKTQILTLRIANILRKTQMNPRNILALTFTESAASNMRKRLTSIIGPAAYGVGIHTYHGFANLVITEFPHKFQFAKELESIDEIEQIEIIEQIIDSLPLVELRPPRSPYLYLREIIGRIGDVKKEDLTADQLKKIAAAETERLQNDSASFHSQGAYKGKMKADVVQELKQLARTSELADIYDRYQAVMQERGRYDYDDMILFVIEALKRDNDLKAYYQERFQYVLADEYQDTNNSQNRLIELLTDFFESPNLFVVGDDKQSIFRFQGASMANMLLFHKRYPNINVISLKQNYRSHQTILDGSYAIMRNAKERITHYLPNISDELEVGNSANADAFPLEIGNFSCLDIELYYIAKRIKELLAAGEKASEIAVIYKENREAIPLSDFLARLQVPFNLEKGSNVLLDVDISRLLSMMRAVADPTDSRSLFSLLHYDFIGLPGTDLMRIMSFRAKNRASLLDVLTALPCSCAQHRTNGAGDIRINFLACEQIDDILAKIGNWRIASENKSMPELLETILRESGLLRQITESAQRVERLHRLRRFFDEVKRITARHPDLRLENLLKHFDRLILNNIQLVPQSLNVGEGVGSVRLMTAHKAKGLEFKHVFLPNLVDKHWGNSRRKSLIKLPACIIQAGNFEEEENGEDERRLFYVALTRAKRHLYLTYSESKNGKEQLPSQFLAEINPSYLSPIAQDAALGPTGAHLMALFSPIKENSFTSQEEEYLRQLISELPITPTGLNNYLRCPMGYLYKNILRIPTAKTAAAGFGSAIHAAMQQFFLRHRATKHIPPLADLLQDFETALSKEIMSTADFAAFLREGRATLTAYFEHHLRTVVPTVAVEYSFDDHHVTIPSTKGDIWITGRLDKLELLDVQTKSVRVIDYKTGRARTRNEILGLTAKQDEDYIRQLRFYQLLAQSDKQFPYKVTQTGLAFVDKEQKFSIESFTISKAEVEDLRQLIVDAYGQMQNLEFSHIEDPNREPCELCSI